MPRQSRTADTASSLLDTRGAATLYLLRGAIRATLNRTAASPVYMRAAFEARTRTSRQQPPEPRCCCYCCPGGRMNGRWRGGCCDERSRAIRRLTGARSSVAETPTQCLPAAAGHRLGSCRCHAAAAACAPVILIADTAETRRSRLRRTWY